VEEALIGTRSDLQMMVDTWWDEDHLLSLFLGGKDPGDVAFIYISSLLNVFAFIRFA
jgi:hypothetical protein